MPFSWSHSHWQQELRSGWHRHTVLWQSYKHQLVNRGRHVQSCFCLLCLVISAITEMEFKHTIYKIEKYMQIGLNLLWQLAVWTIIEAEKRTQQTTGKCSYCCFPCLWSKCFYMAFYKCQVVVFLYAFGQSAYTYVRPNFEVGAKLVPPNRVPRTKCVPSSCGENRPKSGYFCQ